MMIFHLWEGWIYFSSLNPDTWYPRRKSKLKSSLAVHDYWNLGNKSFFAHFVKEESNFLPGVVLVQFGLFACHSHERYWVRYESLLFTTHLHLSQTRTLSCTESQQNLRFFHNWFSYIYIHPKLNAFATFNVKE